MTREATDYLEQARALLPRGPLWDSLAESNTTFSQLLAVLVEEFARIDARADDLIDETDPRSVYELLSEWEQFAGLPDSCVTGDQTLQQRRENLLAQLANDNGSSHQFFIDLAASLGYTITITEFDAYDVGDDVNNALYNNDWHFVWQVNAPKTTVDYFTAESTVDEPLAAWGNKQLECIIDKYRAAHTKIIFTYQ